MEENGIRKGLKTYTATRWYSAIQVAMSVEGVEEGLMVCMGEGFATQNPLPSKVSTVLQEPGHFIKTRLLVTLLKPLTDSIARLEKLSASLDQTFISIITSYRQVQQAEIDPEFQPWRVAVLSAISSVGNRFGHPAYFVALFLNPQWQTMATSRKYNAESITKETLILAKEFGFTKNQCIQIKSDVADYITLVQARGKWDDTADLWGWWNQLATAEVPAAEAAGSDVTVSPPTYRSRGEAFFEFGSCKDQVSKPVERREVEDDGSNPSSYPGPGR